MKRLITPLAAKWAGVLFGGGLICALVMVCIAHRSFVAPKDLKGVAGDVPLTVTKPLNHTAYVGDMACFGCHQDKVDNYRATAHAQTSNWPSVKTIKGDFRPGTNVLQSENPGLHYLMNAAGTAFTQTAWVQSSPTTAVERTETFGVVIGSGRKGQSYLYWNGDDLFQLPVSYWTEVDCWINSPGYPDKKPYFERPVAPRCLECHATSFESRVPPNNRYNKESLILGVACEKCHGPGAEHIAQVNLRTAESLPTGTPAIINPAKLTRERQIDACALCHGGVGHPVTPPLSFRPGEVLANHITLPKLRAGDELDVHASQFQLLERSKCFRASTTMTCSTCHNVHKPQRDSASFAALCLSCHKLQNCGEVARRSPAIDHRCIDCHMPLETTNQIVFSKDGQEVRPKVRNHRIAIYPEVAPHKPSGDVDRQN